MKILVIRFSPVSEIIAASLLLRSLRKELPDAEIHFLTNDSCRFAVEFNPHINKLHVLAHSRELMVEEIRQEEYDHIIDLQNNEITAGLRSILTARSYTAKKYAFQHWLYHSCKINFFPSVHLADRYLQVASAFNVKNDGAGLDYFISAGEETKKEDIPASHHAGFITCVIADESHGQWSPQKWADFCSAMDHPVILVGEKKDAAAGNTIAAVDPVKVYNACGKFSFNESADLVKKSRVILSPSSGLMYVASAYKRPVVWLNDERLPAYIMAPYYGDQYLSACPKPPFLQCRIKSDIKEIIQSTLSLF